MTPHARFRVSNSEGVRAATAAQQKMKNIFSKAKPFLITGIIAILAVMIYNNYIQPKLGDKLPTA